jgi:hypothetical protein
MKSLRIAKREYVAVLHFDDNKFTLTYVFSFSLSALADTKNGAFISAAVCDSGRNRQLECSRVGCEVDQCGSDSAPSRASADSDCCRHNYAIS